MLPWQHQPLPSLLVFHGNTKATFPHTCLGSGARSLEGRRAGRCRLGRKKPIAVVSLRDRRPQCSARFRLARRRNQKEAKKKGKKRGKPILDSGFSTTKKTEAARGKQSMWPISLVVFTRQEGDVTTNVARMRPAKGSVDREGTPKLRRSASNPGCQIAGSRGGIKPDTSLRQRMQVWRNTGVSRIFCPHTGQVGGPFHSFKR